MASLGMTLDELYPKIHFVVADPICDGWMVIDSAKLIICFSSDIFEKLCVDRGKSIRKLCAEYVTWQHKLHVDVQLTKISPNHQTHLISHIVHKFWQVRATAPNSDHILVLSCVNPAS